MVDASDATSDGPTSCELRYVYPVEVLNLVVLLRLYWFVRLLRYELLRRLFNTHSGVMLLTSGIGRNHLSEMSSLRRSFRICFSLVPGKIVGGLFIVLWFGTAAAVSILERPFPSLLDQEEHSLWLTIVTMSTVGYGDAYPLTAAGRLTVIIGAVLGGALVIALMTSLFLRALKGSKNEHKFVLTLERFAWEKNLQRASANLIAAAWRSYQIQKKQVASELVNKVDRADMLLRMAHEFKMERKQRQPKGTNDSAEQLRVQSIMRWRTTQLDGWLKTCQSEKKQVLDAMQAELKTIEQSMQRLLA
ncbi:hypothetical protein Poli38472_013102 [Pythium oligandrum]|uniref:Potassium channel domain-containing protein n=1 Tax=Pythium oligandrum TaxID=41045 RepID=A0A8K1C2F0_PYTOL|nr:hypothetical protein Poli38472_013102 [Pythium oligandrum]|eukprot:TMW55211.1 hypothetical protein Poli38472_013102 [Pythium oligandrum]